MTAEIVNLNKVRKARARAERERHAGENRAKFGQSRTERDAIDARQRNVKETLDGARREPIPFANGNDDSSDAS